jgi:hypothetical protein
MFSGEELAESEEISLIANQEFQQSLMTPEESADYHAMISEEIKYQ